MIRSAPGAVDPVSPSGTVLVVDSIVDTVVVGVSEVGSAMVGFGMEIVSLGVNSTVVVLVCVGPGAIVVASGTESDSVLVIVSVVGNALGRKFTVVVLVCVVSDTTVVVVKILSYLVVSIVDRTVVVKGPQSSCWHIVIGPEKVVLARQLSIVNVSDAVVE